MARQASLQWTQLSNHIRAYPQKAIAYALANDITLNGTDPSQIVNRFYHHCRYQAQTIAPSDLYAETKRQYQKHYDALLTFEAPEPVAAPLPTVTPQAPTPVPATQSGSVASDIGNALMNVVTALEQRMIELQSREHVDANLVREIVREEFKTLPRKAEIITIQTPDGSIIGKIDGTMHKAFPEFLKAATARMPNGYMPHIWLSGPAGSGKSTAPKQLAEITNREFFFNGALSMQSELIGFIDAGGTYRATAFSNAYDKPSIYCFDDIDGCADASITVALNNALANGHASFPHGIVKRNPDFQCIATANTWGLGATADYVGRTKLDAAFLDRFAVKLHWDYDTELESAICGNPAWADFIHSIRRKAVSKGLKVLITPRATQAGAALLAAGFDRNRVCELTFLANLTETQKRDLMN